MLKKVISVILAVLILATIIMPSVAVYISEKKIPTLTISANNISHTVSDNLYGLSLDNGASAVDSGLVSNLVNNNSFEYKQNPVVSWNIKAQNYEFISKGGLNKNNETFLVVTVSGESTIENIGYPEFYKDKTNQVSQKSARAGDMGFVADKSYIFSAYFKNYDYSGSITLSLSAEGNTETKKFSINSYKNWTKVSFEIKSNVSADGSMLLTCEGNGTFYMDYVTLIPVDSYGQNLKNWTYTSLKTETVTAIKQLSPSFIQFSAGEMDEKSSLKDLGSWKNTIGSPETRAQSYNYNDNGVYYINSNLMGMYEYLTLCEEVGAKPIPILNSGILVSAEKEYIEMLAKYSSGVVTEEEWQEYLDKISLRPETEAFDLYVQSVFNLIEYANGDETTEWGLKRIEDGHVNPFNLQTIALGNEGFGDLYKRNFEAISNAVKSQYPEIEITTCVSEYGINNSSGKVLEKNNIISAIENAKILILAEGDSNANQMLSYSTFLSKINAQTTDVSMLWVNSNEMVCTPDYYMQMLFANNLGTNYIKTDFNLEEKGVYQSVTVDTSEKVIYVKIINNSNKSQKVKINVEGFNNPNNPSVQYIAENFQSAYNGLGKETHIAPKELVLQIEDNMIPYEAKGYSVSVVRIPYDTNNGDGVYKLPSLSRTTLYFPPKVIVSAVCVGVLLIFIIVLVAFRVIKTFHSEITDEIEELDEVIENDTTE